MDYDIGVTGLSSPPASATKSTYRPAVAVRNNGLHDALASGVLRIYAAGQLIFTSEIYSPTIAPGLTKDAEAVDYWTPTEAGFYVIIADVSSPLDQYEPNNHLNPSTIEVTGLPPVPPSPVEPHAPQHEEGGTDEVSIDGLSGKLADPQTALAHVATHQAGGTDALNVGGLLGELSAPQTPKAHSNAYHSPSNATSAELAAHQTATTAHASAANLANRVTTGPETGLVKGEQLATGSEAPNHPKMALTMDRLWTHPRQAALGKNVPFIDFIVSAGELNIVALDVPAAWISNDLTVAAFVRMQNITVIKPGQTIVYRLYWGTTELVAIIADYSSVVANEHCLLQASVTGQAGGLVSGGISIDQTDIITAALRSQILNMDWAIPAGIVNTQVRLTIELVTWNPLSIARVMGGYIRALSPIP
jgi:hypothetical protein